MERVAVSDLTPGALLARTVEAKDGSILLMQGERLSAGTIELLIRRGIGTVTVQGARDAVVADIERLTTVMERWEIPRPEAGPGEILVRVRSAALNFPDILKIAGKHQNKIEPPFSPGSEFAGTVAEVGAGIEGFEEGDRVFARMGSGGFAEYVAVPVDKIVRTPDGMPDEDAAVFSLVYHTSYIALIHRGRLQPGETVLIHSAAGGVGLAAVQIARAKGAGKIIGTVGSDGKEELVRENGADLVVNYQTQDFVDVVKRETDGRGADIIYDPLGGEVGERSAKCITSEGRILIVGFTSGGFPTFRSNHMMVKN